MPRDLQADRIGAEEGRQDDHAPVVQGPGRRVQAGAPDRDVRGHAGHRVMTAMRVLLLGANGQLGHDILRAASQFSSLSVTPLTRKDVDVTDLKAIDAALNQHLFDALINCTSYHKTDDVEANAQQAVTVNAFAVRAMAKACAAKKARLVHYSTDYVFDGLSRRPYREDDQLGPLNVYGLTKAMGESLARTVHDDVLILRVASLFGLAGASGKGGNFVETM